jgi:hypothetical protein
MIAAGHNGHACTQKINGDFSCYSSTTGCVLAVNDDEI